MRYNELSKSQEIAFLNHVESLAAPYIKKGYSWNEIEKKLFEPVFTKTGKYKGFGVPYGNDFVLITDQRSAYRFNEFVSKWLDKY